MASCLSLYEGSVEHELVYEGSLFKIDHYTTAERR